MEEIRVFLIDTDSSEAVGKATGLITSDVREAINSALPVTLLLAAYGNRAAGALAGGIDRGTFDIASLYVDPEFRRKGIGTALIDRLRQILLTKDMMIRADYTLDDKDKRTLGTFFNHNGFTRQKSDNPCFYISKIGDMLIDQEEKMKNRYESMVHSFDELPDKVLRAVGDIAYKDRDPVPNGGFMSPKVDREGSFCVIMNGGIQAYIIFEKERDGIVEIPALWSNIADPRIMMAMIKKSAVRAREKYPPETKIAMIAISSVSKNIITHVFPGAEPSSYRFISMW